MNDKTCNQPRVSIITVVYNGEKHIETTIKQVLNQSYKNIEYIIIDGGSTDGTVDIIRKYESKISRWVSESDKGIYNAMNKGISLASGEVIGLINSDDYYNVTAVERAVSKIQEAGADFSYGKKMMLNEYLQLAKVISVSYPTKLKEVRFNKVHPTVFVKSCVYRKIKFNEEFEVGADYDFFLRLYLSNCKGVEVDHVIAIMRTGGVSGRLNFDEFRIHRSYFGAINASACLLKMLFFTCLVRVRDSSIIPKNVRERLLALSGWRPVV